MNKETKEVKEVKEVKATKKAKATVLRELLPSPACGRGVGGEGDSLLERAKSLRTHQTDAEERLWYYLRAHRFMGLKFKRQKPIGNYIVDFVCFEPSVIVEADGGQHAENAVYDRRRDRYLQSQGFTVLRFWNNEILHETDAVLESIRQAVLTLSPDPSPASGRGEMTEDSVGKGMTADSVGEGMTADSAGKGMTVDSAGKGDDSA